MSPNKPTTRRKGGRRKAATQTVESSSLEFVGGPEVYSVWIGMLRRLGKDGRTHRLAVVVAAMLQHASLVAFEASKRRRGRNAVAGQALLNALQEPEPEGDREELAEAVVRLFEDACVAYTRTNQSGEEYSLTDASIDEFVRWFDMPWE